MRLARKMLYLACPWRSRQDKQVPRGESDLLLLVRRPQREDFKGPMSTELGIKRSGARVYIPERADLPVTLTYSEELRVAIADNDVGMDPSIAERG